MNAALWIYAGMLGLMSLVTLVAYAWDKRQARGGGWRVPEKRLHVMELLGGWPGGLLGRRWLRHKSVKRSFRIRSGLIVCLHGVLVGAAWWWFGSVL